MAEDIAYTLGTLLAAYERELQESNSSASLSKIFGPNALAQASELPGDFNLIQRIQLTISNNPEALPSAIVFGIEKDAQQYTIILTPNLPASSRGLRYGGFAVEPAPNETIEFVLEEALRELRRKKIPLKVIDDDIIASITNASAVQYSEEANFGDRRDRVISEMLNVSVHEDLVPLLGSVLGTGVTTLADSNNGEFFRLGADGQLTLSTSSEEKGFHRAYMVGVFVEQEKN